MIPAISSNLSVNSSDWIVTTLSSLIDKSGLLAAGIYYYNKIMLGFGGLLLSWLMVRGVVATAQHGRPLGQHSETWVPIRFIVAVGLMSPLPPAGLAGGQELIVGVAEHASSVADKLWTLTGAGIDQMKPLVLPATPPALSLAHGVWDVAACSALLNQISTYKNMSAYAITITKHIYKNETVWSADEIDHKHPKLAVCGAISFPAYAGSMTKNITDTESYQTIQLFNKFYPVAQKLALSLLPHTGPGPAVGPQNIGGEVASYEAAVEAAAKEVVAQNNASQASRQALQAATTAGGWVQAGAWALRIASTNAQLNRAMDDLPKVTPPKMRYFESGWTTFRAALAGEDQFFLRQAQDSDPAFASSAYNAGTTDSFWAPVDISRWRGIYDTLAINDTTTTNPFASIQDIGNGLLNVVGASTATYVAITVASQSIKGVLDAVPFVGEGLAKIGGAIADAVSSISSRVTAPLFWIVMEIIEICGLTLAFFLPFLPFLYWILAVGRYIIQIFTGILAIPLFAIAHLDLDSTEGMGSATRPGYLLLLDLAIRPMLLVLFLLISIAIFIVTAKLFTIGFYPALRNTLAGHYGGFSGLFAFTILLVAGLVMLAHYSFKLILFGPDSVMGLIGQSAGQQFGEEQAGTNTLAVASSGGRQIGHGASQAAGRAGAGGGGAGGPEGTWRPTGGGGGGRIDDSIGRIGGPTSPPDE